MKIGLYGINMGPCSTPDASARVAQAAEAAGFESVWAGEHVVLPEPQEPPSPLPPTYPMLDPNIAFAYLAGQTKTIRMGFGLDTDRTKECLNELQEAQKKNERPSALGKLEISVTPIGRIDLDTAKRFADLGVDRLILLPPTQSDEERFSLTVTQQELLDYVRHIGDTVVGQVWITTFSQEEAGLEFQSFWAAGRSHTTTV